MSTAGREARHRPAGEGRCRHCAQFRNDPAFLEAAFKGLASLSSAYGSVRADDGLCLAHDRYLSGDGGCADFTPRAPDDAG